MALCGGVDVNADRIGYLPPAAWVIPVRSPGCRAGKTLGQAAADPGGSGNPLHDVHARVTGPTALPLLRVFLRRWWARSGDHGIDRRSPLRGNFSQAMPGPTEPVRPHRGNLQRRAARARGQRQQQAGDRPGHLATLDPRCPPVHLHGGAVPDQRLRRGGHQGRAAPAGTRHDPHRALGNHRHARRMGPALRRSSSRITARNPHAGKLHATPGRPGSASRASGTTHPTCTCTRRWR